MPAKDSPVTLIDVERHLAEAREIIEGKGRGSSFAPETTTVGQCLLALEDLTRLVNELQSGLQALAAVQAQLRNWKLEQEARAGTQ